MAFSDNRLLQDTVGYVLHSALLVPYFSWQRSHAVHHANTNHIYKGETHVPSVINGRLGVEEQNGEVVMDFAKKLGEKFHGAFQLFGHLTIGCACLSPSSQTRADVARRSTALVPAPPPHRSARTYLAAARPSALLLTCSTRAIPSRASCPQGRPTSYSVTRADRRTVSPTTSAWRALLQGALAGQVGGKVVQSSAGVLAFVALLAWWASKAGAASVLALYGGPYLVINAWLVAYTWLQHTDVDVPHLAAEEFSYMRGASSQSIGPTPS